MRKGSTLTEEQKQKVSDGVRKAYANGFTAEHRQRQSEAQRKRFALTAVALDFYRKYA